ncbi:MAG: hypothetical protein ACE5G5_04915 [Candidatus Methylomirabilales bacterium]
MNRAPRIYFLAFAGEQPALVVAQEEGMEVRDWMTKDVVMVGRATGIRGLPSWKAVSD